MVSLDPPPPLLEPVQSLRPSRPRPQFAEPVQPIMRMRLDEEDHAIPAPYPIPLLRLQVPLLYPDTPTRPPTPTRPTAPIPSLRSLPPLPTQILEELLQSHRFVTQMLLSLAGLDE
eukprot:12427202-Karenia_brevis.AAC.1